MYSYSNTSVQGFTVEGIWHWSGAALKYKSQIGLLPHSHTQNKDTNKLHRQLINRYSIWTADAGVKLGYRDSKWTTQLFLSCYQMQTRSQKQVWYTTTTTNNVIQPNHKGQPQQDSTAWTMRRKRTFKFWNKPCDAVVKTTLHNCPSFPYLLGQIGIA